MPMVMEMRAKSGALIRIYDDCMRETARDGQDPREGQGSVAITAGDRENSAEWAAEWAVERE